MTLPWQSPDAIKEFSVLKAKAVGVNFCLTVNTIWSFFKFKKAMIPLSNPKLMISTKGVAST